MTASPVVFLCHASEDKDFVNQLHLHLKPLDVATWYDKINIGPGDNLKQKIFTEGIPNCTHAAIVYSHASTLKSGWVAKERRFIKKLKVEGQIKIIPIVIDRYVDQDLLKEASGVNYIPFIDWEKPGVFQVYLPDVLRAVGKAPDDDMARFDSKDNLIEHWNKHKHVSFQQAKDELYTIFEVPAISYSESWHSRYKVEVARYFCKRIRSDMKGRVNLVEYALSQEPSSFALLDERGMAYRDKWKKTKDKDDFEEAKKSFLRVWGESREQNWKCGNYLFELYRDNNEPAEALLWFERVRSHRRVTIYDRLLETIGAADLYADAKNTQKAKEVIDEWVCALKESVERRNERKLRENIRRTMCDKMEDYKLVLSGIYGELPAHVGVILEAYKAEYCTGGNAN